MPPPPTPLPPAPPPNGNLADRINARFARDPTRVAWPASGAVPDAGVLVHMIDSYENRETGAQGRQNLLWTPSPVSDDISGSVIWAGQKVDLNSQLALFDGIGGFVLRPHDPWRPDMAGAAVRCGNGGDAGGHCHPFCPAPTHMADSAPRPWPGDGNTDGCSWRPQHFGEFLRRVTSYQHGTGRLYYNEITIDAKRWRDFPRGTIDAIFVVEGKGDVLELHSLHDRYRQKYGLSKHEFPLLELNPIRWGAPFRAYK